MLFRSFQLEERNAKPGDPNHYLTDGKVTLVIQPYSIRNYVGTNVLTPGFDHFGFSVESGEKVKEDLDEAIGANPLMAGVPLGRGKEGARRLELAREQAPYADFFIADPDYTLVAVSVRGDGTETPVSRFDVGKPRRRHGAARL